jgi:hypothetical protein
MVLPQMVLRVLPELVVILALDDVATEARDLFHALIVRAAGAPALTRKEGVPVEARKAPARHEQQRGATPDALLLRASNGRRRRPIGYAFFAKY